MADSDFSDQSPTPAPSSASSPTQSSTPSRPTTGTLLDRVGLWTAGFPQDSVAECRAIAVELDGQGWQSLWFGEAYGREAFAQARILLEGSERMQVGTGIANIWARDAAASASIARTYEAMYPGRFVLGLGVSHAPLVQRRSHDYSRPLAAMTEYVEHLYARAPEVAGEEKLPEIVLAALGPKMLALSGKRTSGAHPYLTTPEHTAQAREILGGSADDGPLLVVEQGAVIAPSVVRGTAAGEEEWARRAHEHLEVYTGLPNYRNSWARLGFDETDFVRGGSARLKETLVPCGVEQTIAAVRAHLDAGASHVLVQVLGTQIFVPPLEDWSLLARALAEEPLRR